VHISIASENRRNIVAVHSRAARRHRQAGTLASLWALPPFLCDPLDPDPSTYNRSLIETISTDLSCSDPPWSNGCKPWSTQKGIDLSEVATWPAPRLNIKRFRN
jgi:hypothetical protein